MKIDIADLLRLLGAKAEREGLRLYGRVESTLVRPDGSTLVRVRNNLIVDTGFDFIADAIGKASGRPGVMSHIAIGTGTTAAVVGDTALQTEIARKAAIYSHTAGTKVFAFDATFDPGEATGAITEAAVINAAGSGTLLDRVVFAVINKGADDTLTQRFTFTMS